MKAVMSMVDRLCEQSSGLVTPPPTGGTQATIVQQTTDASGISTASSTPSLTQTTSRIMTQNILGILT